MCSLKIVFASLLVTLVTVQGASIFDRHTPGTRNQAEVTSDERINAAEQVDSAIQDLTILEGNIKDDQSPELLSLQEQTRQTVKFLKRNRDAIILRLQNMPDNRSFSIVDLIAQIGLPEDGAAPEDVSQGISQQVSEEDIALPSKSSWGFNPNSLPNSQAVRWDEENEIGVL